MVTRYQCLQVLASKIRDQLVVTSIGGVAREWFSLKDRDGNLYRIYMGGATALALGLALALPHREVIGLDGDGSMLMGLSILPTLAYHHPSNLVVIVFDNESYEAVGKLSTFTAGSTDLASMARAAGIESACRVGTLREFEEAIDAVLEATKTGFIVAKVEKGAAPVPYAPLNGQENKYRFIRYIETTENRAIIKPPARPVLG